MGCKFALILFAVSLSAFAGADTRYFSVTLAGKKAGYTRVQTESVDGGLKVTSDCLIKLNMLGAPFDMQYQAIAVYAKPNDRLPTRYTVTLNAGPRTITADCKFNGNKIVIDSNVNGAKEHKTATLPAGCYLLEGNLPETWERIVNSLGKYSGTHSIQVFQPTQGGPIPMKLVWKDPKSFEMEVSGQSLSFVWDPVKRTLITMDEPTQKAQFKIAEKSAMKDLESYEAAARAFAVSNVMFDDPGELDSVTMDLNAQVGGEKISFETLQSKTQKFTGKVIKNRAVDKLEIRKMTYAGKGAAKYPLDEPTKKRFARYLKPSAMQESDDPAVRAQALKLVKGSKTTWEAARKIGDWVHENIAYKITGTGAKECLRSKEGDCGPHTNLTIALLRAAGIPAHITGGAMYSGILGGSYGQHYWTKVWVGEKDSWVPIDTTSGEIGTLSPTHITLWDGMTGIGSLELKVVDFSPKPKKREAATSSASARHSMGLKAGETWTWKYTQDGKSIGTETAKVEEIRPDGSVRISYREELSVPQGKATLSGEVNLSADGGPLGMTLKVEQASIVQTVNATVTAGKINIKIEAAGQKVNRDAELPADGYIGMASTIVPWDLMLRSRTWQPGAVQEMAIYLIDGLKMERVKWKILGDETVKHGTANIPCLVIGKDKNSEQFYVSKETGELVKAVQPGAKLVVERKR
jgi:transglutaminase-like putative cysteine protease